MTGVTARLESGVCAFAPADWDRCAGSGDPFVGHAFLSALERSGSVGGDSGWQPLPLAIDGVSGPDALLPAYAKSNSLGEFVFDHGWAEAWERAGGDYYPKLQIAVPFTPVPGRRLLTADPALRPALIAAAEHMVAQYGLSSAHATFVDAQEIEVFRAAGWLIRNDLQFHWHNRGYRDFDGFLADLAARKRKAIRKERASIPGDVEIIRLTGAEIEERHWDAFWAFYQDTGSRKWGRPYLTRAFFSLIGESLKEHLLLILARRGGRDIAGALNFRGSDAIYGRYWGAIEPSPFLHFELCYYQAIEAAIELGVERVEAGAQGAHKLARGYLPVTTFSAHFIADPGFREAVKRFVDAERRGVALEADALELAAPFRKK